MSQLKIYSRSEHNISRQSISNQALKVLYRLHNAGYRACLVGGAVRDILLGYQPKDFDIATDAKPEEIKALFSNCRLIGRRFKLAHILFGREIIEVATFRGHHEESTEGHVEDGRIIRDNVYGSIEEDAYRRDFTINALFYDIDNFKVLDYCNAMQDIKTKTLRMIGQADKRYREDPVRMLRAVRLATKLNLNIAKDAAEPLAEMAPLLVAMPGARLWDESHKLFLAGCALDTFKALEKHQLLASLLPLTAQSIQATSTSRDFIYKALSNTDKRIREQKPINPGFLYACFLWWPILNAKQKGIDKGLAPVEAMQRAIATVIKQQISTIALPRRFTQFMRDVWTLQHRLEFMRGRNLLKLLEHRCFRAAYDILVLRAQSGEIDSKAVDWWTEVQTLPPAEQHKLVNAIRPKHRHKKTRKRAAK